MPSPRPLIIGVTGHRVLAEPAKIASGVDEALRRIHDACPGRSQTLVSSLAEGSDRLAARRALERPGTRLVVLLPLPRADYKQDFASAESQREFDDLLRLAADVVEPPGPLPREDAYDAVGRAIVERADIVLAVWDGQAPQGQGGTGAVVAAARARGLPVAWVHAGNRRPGTMEPTSLGDEQGRVTFERFDGLDTGPRERHGNPAASSEREAAFRRYVDNVDRELFGSRIGARLDPAARRLVKEQLLPHYVRSSLEAKTSQRAYRRAGLAVWTLFPAAVAAVAYGALASGAAALAAFAAEFVLLVAILVVVVAAHRARTHEKWIESRFLTERIRAACLLTACGVEPASGESPAYAGKAGAAHDAPSRAFDDICSRLPRLPGVTPENCDTVRRYIRWHGIRGQVRYHERTAARAGRISRALERCGVAAFALAILVALAHLVLTLAGHGERSVAGSALTFGAMVLPAVGAALGGFRAHREYSRLARRSRSMAQGLRRLKRRFAGASSPDEVMSLVRETERAMLSETHDWLALMEPVRIEPPG